MASGMGLLVFSPLIIIVGFLVWLQDFCSPFYIAPRVARGGGLFKMYKLRSMVKNADKSGVDSTSADDMRITKVGHFIRSYKLDEISQLINVFLGDMSLVGPRPNVKRETDLYTEEEKKLLSVRPGITDLASIVFSDEGDILKGESDPDLAYNQLIRPWKSRLALFSIEKSSLIFDIQVILVTIIAVLSREKALEKVVDILKKNNAEDLLIEVASRKKKLVPTPPPGASTVVMSR